MTHFVLASAQAVLPMFEDACPGDVRPRAAVEAARDFRDGGRRTALQRTTALDAHRAARQAPTEVARLAARAAGDAAASAYLHPIARATQVGHILRAPADQARIAELLDGPAAGARVLAESRDRATAVLIDVLGRYPAAPPGRSPTARWMSELDAALRR
ncbi:hypothetical protein GCM10023339_33930 [Alloalcanivorax gelatiniphagus]